MKKVFLEYVWLDGNQPQQLRSKTKVVKPEDMEKYTDSNDLGLYLNGLLMGVQQNRLSLKRRKH